MKTDEKPPAGRGGARPGAGRKRKVVSLGPIDGPRELLEAIIRSDDCIPSVRLAAAKTLLQILRVEEIEKNPFPKWR